MAGGLLNIVALGNNNVFLTGNPTKTFFKVTYAKYTNFGLQKFRIDFNGSRDLRLTEPSTFRFKMPRYADLLMDTYLVIALPDIWSPIYNPTDDTNQNWSPFEFKWIRNIGTAIIKEISIESGSTILQKYSGQYISCAMERDFTSEKKNLFNKMTGNVSELYDPANSNGNNGNYPSCFYTSNSLGSQPSILGRNLVVPLNSWFMLNSGAAFPLISLQYNELYINVTLRPIQELFQVRDVFDYKNNYPHVQPNFNSPQFQMYRFLQTPPSTDISTFEYENTNSVWNSDVHLISTYCFLSTEETKIFAANDQVYLIKDIYEYNFEDFAETTKVSLNSTGMVASWMWFLQRNDVNTRNEWTNYTNLPYQKLNYDLIKNFNVSTGSVNYEINPVTNSITGISITGDYKAWFVTEIMQTMGILLNGDYRENVLTSDVYNYIEKYTRTDGFAENYIYCYNFCLNTSPFEYQPSGAINLNKFKDIQLEITTITPTTSNQRFTVLCDGNGNPIGTSKTSVSMFDYMYRMTLFEERHNILSFIGGNCGLMYAR
jgi:hypothetical protein